MARQRSPNRDKAFEMWKKSGGSMKLKDIAAELGLQDTQIRKWKNQDQWESRLKGNVTIDDKGNVTKRKGAPLGNKFAVGNKGNPNPPNQFTERNTFAKKHGLFSKYIPKETLEIMGTLDKSDPADLIWDQIQIQYAAIIRAQNIMFVTDKEEMIKELKREKESWGDKSSGSETEWEFQFAWDRHATFLNAQSRAMSELRSMIKQFNEMAHESDERRLKLEQMQLNIEKTKVEVEKLSSDDDKPIEILIKRKT